MKHGLILALLALTTGCATCREHRAICTTVAIGLAAGSIAASDSHRTEQPRVGITQPNCANGSCK